MKNVRDDIDYNVWHNVRVNVSEVWHNIRHDVSHNTSGSVWSGVRDGVWKNVGVKIRENEGRFTQKEL